MIVHPIRDVHGDEIAYRCRRCGEIVPSVWDGYCKKCQIEIYKEEEEKRDKKVKIFGFLIAVIKRK
jgi:ribosomal protein L37E